MLMAGEILFLVEPAYAAYLAPVRLALERLGHPQGELLASAQLEDAHARIEDASILVTVHSLVPAIARVCDCVRGRVPTLTIQDGVIEYRHCMYPAKGVSRYAPLRTDAIAAFGAQSHAMLRALGVAETSIHITGNPRFDVYGAAQPTQARAGSLLITSANRPTRQVSDAIRYYLLLQNLFAYLDAQSIPFHLRLSRHTEPRKLSAIETVADQLDPLFVERYRALGAQSRSLMEDLDRASAVITTPSTVALEAMIKGLPVALLEYDAETTMTPSVWKIRCADDVAFVVPQLLNPPALKLSLQDVYRAECLLQDGAASEHVAALILAMLRS